MTTDTPFPANVLACLDGYDTRCRHSLLAVAEADCPPRTQYGKHLYGILAIAKLALSRDLAAANEELRTVAAWFDLPHPTGRDHLGECDFAAIKLSLAWHHPALNAHLEDDTRTAIRRFFLTQRFHSMYPSENHVLLFRVSRLLMAQAFPRELFAAYERTGEELYAEDRQWLDDFIRFRAARGWGEFDSTGYLLPDWEALTSLYDFADDAELRRLAGMMLDLLLADMAVDSLRGMYCGAHGRIYPREALNHAREGSYPLQYLYFGLGDETEAHRCLIDALLSSYRPSPLVVDIALNRPNIYENRERKHLHKLSDTRPSAPLDGSIRKVTYYSPDFVLGCVQYQDPYLEDGTGDHYYAHHQQHQWDLTFATRTDARLFTHHPGDFNEHNYWTGDLGCGCGYFFQCATAVLALYDIPDTQPMPYIHACVPAEAFDELVEEGNTLFVRAGRACAALSLLNGYTWTRDGEWAHREVISHGLRHAVVCEAGMLETFGSFADFRAEIRANAIHFDADTMALTYISHRAGTVTLDTRGRREVNGLPAHLDYATYDCPYLRAAWDSGVIELARGDRRQVLDFTRRA